MKRITHTLLITTICLGAAAAAQAQYWDATGTVRGSGTVTIERQPERMEMEVDVLFRGDTVEEAVAGLREQIEIARLQLVELGAMEDSITVGDPEINTAQSDQQRMMEQMIAQNLRGGGRAQPAEEEKKQPVTVTAVMKAAWALEQADASELLVMTHALQQRIREADVAGSKEASQLTPEEEEVLEEMQGMYGRYGYGSGEAEPGEPLFSFVADITEDEYRQALADAFQDAKAQAALLAAATGSELGKLESVVSHAQAGLDSSDYSYGYDYQSAYYRAYQRLSSRGSGSSGGAPDGPRVAVGVKPGKVRYNVTVGAGFGLKGE